MLCCIIKSLVCVVILAAAALCTWRFGPWYGEDDNSPPETLKALNTCESCCNGLASNCNKPLNQVTFAMAHNAMSSLEDSFMVNTYNHLESLEKALVAGYRGLMLDSCNCAESTTQEVMNEVENYFNEQEDTGSGVMLGFCHSTCDGGYRDPATVLGNIRTFLEVNRNEVLIIEFEITGGTLADLHNAIDESGLDAYAYKSNSTTSVSTEWPTMQSLIDDNTRVILFAHGDGMESCATSSCPEGIFYTYDHFEETNWNDSTCDIKGNEQQGMQFFLMNHWMNNDADLPSEENAETFNTHNSLTQRFSQCSSNKVPNIVAVDFWSIGDVLPFVREKNMQNGSSGGDTSSASQ